MINMKENIITIYDSDNNINKYKILLIIKKDYLYIIYTDMDNYNLKNNLYAVKTKSLESNEVIPINEDEWQMIEEKFKNSISIK